MSERTRARSSDDHDADDAPLTARAAADLAREYIAEMTQREPVTMTSVAPTDEGGWLIEVEVIEDRRIPSSSDILAVYEAELDGEGELLAYRRINRYMRGQTRNGGEPS